jgi:serine/threonine protein kinase
MRHVGSWAIHLERRLGSGTWAEVYYATNLESGIEAAAKVIPKAKLKQNEIAYVQKEIYILSNVSHRNIISLYEALEDEAHYYLFLSLARGGDLFEVLERMPQQKLSESVARKIMIQLVDALAHLHAAGIVHRDLKLEQILVSAPFDSSSEEVPRVFLADFGLADFLWTDESTLDTPCGSPLYASPEVILRKQYRFEPDIWALGVILYTLVMGYQPFYSKHIQQVFQKIVYDKVHIPDTVSPSLRDLLSKLLTKDPSRRITLAELRRHPWMLGCPELMTPFRWKLGSAIRQQLASKVVDLRKSC